MMTMPFIKELRHWAAVRGDRTAVVVGEQRLSYAQLLQAAQHQPKQDAGTSPVVVIELPTSVELAIKFCSAVVQRRPVMVLDTQWPDGVRRALMGQARAWASSRRQQPEAPETFLLGLSSGTSGVPKAFLRPAISWHTSFLRSAEYFDVGESTLTLAPGPLAASMNLYALGESLFSGGTFLALPHFSPDAALDAMVENGASRLVLVPTILGLMAARGLATGRSGEQLSSIVCAGSEMPDTLLALVQEWAPHARIQQYYGAAELGFVSAVTMTGTDTAGDQGVGQAFPGAEIAIRDELGQDCAPGQQGDVWVKGPYACDGYAWGDDGLAFTVEAAAEPDQRWCTVRDQGSLDARGRLHLAGRASDMVNVSGANVYPHPVEQLLRSALEAAGVRAPRVIVAGIPDLIRGQRLIAACHDAGAEQQLLDTLRRAAQHLPESHRPRAFFALSELPLTGSGKISRALLSHWITEGDPRAQRLR
ncbi:AMP-dependent synthetase [Arthrobacter psychrolactophilus]|uniref:AMP-dependent synthetase n=2 Tax=Arthrobacter psychrolactophilus TaxID=92442 RepID=A0A2V5IST3_9MICC|nr:AMP-dependent synthetase [Arthrobacter psychrolactophilus]